MEVVSAVSYDKPSGTVAEAQDVQASACLLENRGVAGAVWWEPCNSSSQGLPPDPHCLPPSSPPMLRADGLDAGCRAQHPARLEDGAAGAGGSAGPGCCGGLNADGQSSHLNASLLLF